MEYSFDVLPCYIRSTVMILYCSRQDRADNSASCHGAIEQRVCLGIRAFASKHAWVLELHPIYGKGEIGGKR